MEGGYGVKSALGSLDLARKTPVRKKGVFIWTSRDNPEQKTCLQREIDATDRQIGQFITVESIQSRKNGLAISNRQEIG